MLTKTPTPDVASSLLKSLPVFKAKRQFQTLSDEALEKLRPHDITVSQVMVMLAIRAAEETPDQTFVQTATMMDRSTVSDVMRRLVRKKHVRRARSRDDARRYVIALTKDGEAALMEAIAALQ